MSSVTKFLNSVTNGNNNATLISTKSMCKKCRKKICTCNYPSINCSNNEQYLYFKDGKLTYQQKVLPCQYDTIDCCINGKTSSTCGNCGLLIPGSTECNTQLYNYCLNNFDDNCKTICANPNYPSWCEDIGKEQCSTDPNGEICTYFCSTDNRYSFCPVKIVPYIPKQYSLLFYIACVISILILLLLLL